MHYKRFQISNYRAITGSVEIDLERDSLVPIIGINESGKTTILHALFAFDFYNDKLNDNGRHLQDTNNLYQTSQNRSVISAEVALTVEEFAQALDDVLADDDFDPEQFEELRKNAAKYRRSYRKLPPSVTIFRDLKTRTYTLSSNDLFPDLMLNNLIARKIITGLPYILFFDDFRDSVDERIEILPDGKGKAFGWLSILERLFMQADPHHTVFGLPELDERTRKTVISRVERHLNETLTKEWQNFRLDDTDSLHIAIDYEPLLVDGGVTRHFLKLSVIERDSDGNEYHFYIRDRSKGFFWFFNFVMKLEFNPKIVDPGHDREAIYLLDEPGSYLHASAQSKLCGKLMSLSQKNYVIYCTHSHYLLDPEIIPLSSIKVADKDSYGNIRLISIHDYKGSISERRSAFQPVMDALQIKPFLLNLDHQYVLITEGIFDYYAFEMFKEGRTVNVLPSVGASSVKYYVSLMIAWRVKFCALWDSDDEGQREKDKATRIFGKDFAARHFFSLPLKGPRAKKRELQDLFDGNDLRLIRNELHLPKNASFKSTIASLYYHQNKAAVLSKISTKTKTNFDDVFSILPLP